MEFRSRITMILRWKGNYHKVLAVRIPGKDLYRFDCLNLKTHKTETFKFRLGGFLEAADTAFKTMKKPKDIFFLDMDNHAKAIVATEEQTNKL
jgi:hypothetical protein